MCLDKNTLIILCSSIQIQSTLQLILAMSLGLVRYCEIVDKISLVTMTHRSDFIVEVLF